MSIIDTTKVKRDDDGKVLQALEIYLHSLNDVVVKHVLGEETYRRRIAEKRLALGQVLHGGKVLIELPGTIQIVVEDYGA